MSSSRRLTKSLIADTRAPLTGARTPSSCVSDTEAEQKLHAKTDFFMSQTPHGGFVYHLRRPTLASRRLLIRPFLIWPDGERRCPLSRGAPDARESSPRFRAVQGITVLDGICPPRWQRDMRLRVRDQGYLPKRFRRGEHFGQRRPVIRFKQWVEQTLDLCGIDLGYAIDFVGVKVSIHGAAE